MEIPPNPVIRSGRDRERWLDLTKGIGIILVVWAHAISKETYVWILINQFHMPLFFMMSGYLYKTKENWCEFLIGKIRGLWVPYVTSSLITMIISTVLGEEGSVIFSFKRLIKMCLLLEHGPLLGATWFIQVLFYAVILYDLITRVIKRMFGARSEIVITIIDVTCLIVGIFTHFPNHISVTLNTVFFLHLGQMIKKYKKLESWRIPVFVLFLCICAGIAVINRTSYSQNSYTNPLLFIVSAVAGSIGVLGICKKTYRENRAFRTLSFLGENSMGPVIWQFVSFKIVIAIQILVYHLPWSRLSDFPVIYEYAYGGWVLLEIVIGIVFSIIIYKLFNTPIDKLMRKLEKKVVKRLT